MALDAAEQKLVDDVAGYGWHIMKVSTLVGEPEEPPFAYTIGLEATFGWPELLCCGLATDTMTSLLNNAVDELREANEPPRAGLVLREVAEGFDCKLAPVAKRHHANHLGFAIWFARYSGKDPQSIQCLQLLWPDSGGRYPNEAECSEGVKELQPVLNV